MYCGATYFVVPAMTFFVDFADPFGWMFDPTVFSNIYTAAQGDGTSIQVSILLLGPP
jgi:hypothetical protein